MWILADKWIFADNTISVLRDPARYQAHIRRLVRAINTILKEYRRRQTEEAGEDVERLLGEDPPPPQGNMAPDEGVVSSCGQPCVAARSGYP